MEPSTLISLGILLIVLAGIIFKAGNGMNEQMAK